MARCCANPRAKDDDHAFCASLRAPDHHRRASPMTKTSSGNFFEDFRLGQTIKHATPRTVTTGDVALYNALFGARFPLQSSDMFAYAVGYPQSPIDDLLVF